ncbi:MAG: hypothetical protein IID39_05600 [Planctomycetes bacterium]|nr:hypothetical protein [Planctomycetota bacterium]
MYNNDGPSYLDPEAGRLTSRSGKDDLGNEYTFGESNPWTTGIMFIPRIGQEVIVDFLEGDPDRPIITGPVYNADHMPPYAYIYEVSDHFWAAIMGLGRRLTSSSTCGGQRSFSLDNVIPGRDSTLFVRDPDPLLEFQQILLPLMDANGIPFQLDTVPLE